MNKSLSLKALFSIEQLDLKQCLKSNGILGALLCGAAIILIIDKETTNIPIIQLTFGIPLLLGLLWRHYNFGKSEILLCFHGILILLLVIFYSAYMYDIFIHYSSLGKIKIAHVPGLLAVGAAYGTKLILDTTKLIGQRNIIKNISIVAFCAGAICDLCLLYFMISTINN